MRMPFGKHKGKPLDEIPKDYLLWIRENITLGQHLAECIDAVLCGEPLPSRPDKRTKGSYRNRNTR